MEIHHQESNLKTYLALFGSGMLQVTFVALNTWQLSHDKWVGGMFVGFLISLIWTFNVKKIAFGNWIDRLCYAGGACIGTLIGWSTAKMLYT